MTHWQCLLACFCKVFSGQHLNCFENGLRRIAGCIGEARVSSLEALYNL